MEEERARVAELFFESHMTQQQGVDKLGFPARQCFERWLSSDDRYHDQGFKRGFYLAELKLEAGDELWAARSRGPSPLISE